MPNGAPGPAMPQNIEIKARVADRHGLLKRATALATGDPIEIHQDDTFFRCASGRLKLRDFGNGQGELIFYQRADAMGPKVSFYVRSPAVEPASLREALRLAYGVIGRVVKQRTLLLSGRTRIHLDRVNGLGDFMELEVVLGDLDNPESGVEEAETLMASLGIEAHDLVESAYLDLLVTQELDGRNG